MDNLPDTNVYSSRNCNLQNYREFMCNTSRYKNSFFPDSIKSWNNIGSEFTEAHSIAVFKKQIMDMIRPKPKTWYNIHDPIGLKFLFQLRVCLSPLKYHKKRHNFLDTTDDRCDCGNSPENLTHFLFDCPLHAEHRLEIRNTVENILRPKNLSHLIENTELYLYGHKSLQTADDKTILMSTINFIKDSNIF